MAVEHILFHVIGHMEAKHPGLLDRIEGSLEHLGDPANDDTKDDEAVRDDRPQDDSEHAESLTARKAAPVPSGRLSRLARFGGLGAQVAGGVLAEGARRAARGERPRLGDLLLTPANARRVTDQLSTLRGAAMKLGQLVSMDAGDVLPAELSDILGTLRSDAQPMPRAQLLSAVGGVRGGSTGAPACRGSTWPRSLPPPSARSTARAPLTAATWR